LFDALPKHIREGRFGGRATPIVEAVGLVLDEDIICLENLPPFARSLMDGYAVRAEDTFGASEGLPTYLRLIGEVRMGEVPSFVLRLQDASAIPTGGMLPNSADAVVAVEQTQPWGEDSIEVLKPVAPGENIVRVGDDIRAGEMVLPTGHRLRAQDVSALAGLGIARATVRRPRVAILSTGSELVPHNGMPEEGQMRDMNGPALQAATRSLGADPVDLGIMVDNAEQIASALRRGVEEADLILVSGSTSVGVEDVMHEIIDSLGEPGVIVHGLAVKPGKPAIIGLVGDTPIFGMPGHPTSCLIIFREIVAPLLRAAFEAKDAVSFPSRARLARNFPSQAGREEFVPVQIVERDGVWEAIPVLGPSASISTLVRANGLIRISAAAEGVYAGDEVEVESLL